MAVLKLFIIKILLRKEGIDMAFIFARCIMKGLRLRGELITFKGVPEYLKEDVREILIASDAEQFIIED